LTIGTAGAELDRPPTAGANDIGVVWVLRWAHTTASGLRVEGKGRSMEAANAANGRHATQAAGAHADALSERDLKILEFERQWWKYAGAKEQAMREKFDMSATRYYQALNALIDRTAALEADPMLVKRLRRLRAARQRARSARRLGIEA
jgi:Protein of unknown function (DUF3263)